MRKSKKRVNMFKKLCLLAIIAIGALTASAATLTVTVTKEYNQAPVIGEIVLIVDGQGTKTTATTNTSGKATFTNVTLNEKYDIVVEKVFDGVINYEHFEDIGVVIGSEYSAVLKSSEVYVLKPDEEIAFDKDLGEVSNCKEGVFLEYPLIYLPAKIDIFTVKSIAPGTFYKLGIKNLELPNTLEYIGKEALYGNGFETFDLPVPAAEFNKWEASDGAIYAPGTIIIDLAMEFKAILHEESIGENPEEAPPGMAYYNSKNGFLDEITAMAFHSGVTNYGFFGTNEELYRYEILNNKIQATPKSTRIDGGSHLIAINPASNNVLSLNMKGENPLLVSPINAATLDNLVQPTNFPAGNYLSCSHIANGNYFVGSEYGGSVFSSSDGDNWGIVPNMDEYKEIFDITYDANAGKMLFATRDMLIYDDTEKIILEEPTKIVSHLCYTDSTQNLWFYNPEMRQIFVSTSGSGEVTILEELGKKASEIIAELGEVVDIKYKKGAWGDMVCIAGEKGIACFHNNKKWVVHSEGFRAPISCIEILDNGTIWVGTLGAGLVVIYPEVKGEFTANITPGSLIVDFTANFASITSEAKYYFNFDDGTDDGVHAPSGGPVSIQHEFPKSGTYKVYVAAESADGATGNASMYITVTDEATPCAFASFAISQVGSGEISFTNNSLVDGTGYYKWDFGDENGYGGTTAPPNHTYLNNGVYTIYMAAINENKGCVDETKMEVEITDAAGTENIIKAGFTTAVSSDTINFHNTSTGDITGYHWDFGDGYTSALRSPQHIYSKPGTYNVTLVVYDKVSGNADKIAKTVEIEDPTLKCYLSFSYLEIPKILSPTEVNLNVLFAAKLIGTADYFFWDFGDGNYATGKDTIIHTYKEPGTYEVTIQAKSKEAIELSAFNKYSAKVIVTKPSDFNGTLKAYCNAEFLYYVSGNTVKFKNTSTASDGTELKYTWDFGDGQYAYDEHTSHTYKAGVYKSKLTVSGVTTGGIRLIDTYTVPIRIAATYTPIYKADFSYYTDGNIVYFSNTSEGDVTKFIWDFGDGHGYSNDEKSKYTYKEPGYYKVILRIYNETTEKMDEVAKEVVVDFASAICKADFSYHADSNGIVNFVSSAIGDVGSHSWDFDNGRNSNEKDPVHTFSKSGYYDVALTVRNSTNTDMHTIKKRVYVKPFTSQSSEITPVKADFVSNASTDNTSVKFEDRSTGDVLKWYWDFGDNNKPSYEQNPSHTYETSGYYSVCLTIANENFQNTTCENIAVGDVTGKHSSYFTYFADVATNIVHFDNKSAGDISGYYWDFGDGVTSTAEVPSHTYTEEGYYAVCLTSTSTTSESKRYCQDINITDKNIDTCTYNCVWPGDANNDNQADHYDILTVGMNFGMTGPIRIGGSNDWKGQSSQPWANYQIDSTNNMHGDCNGDGEINLDDTLAIHNNFYYSHTPNVEDFTKSNAWTISCELSELPTTKGAATTRTVRTILSGPIEKSADNIYGVGYELLLNGADGVSWSEISVDFDGTFLSKVPDDLITFFTVDSIKKTVYISLSRNDQTNVFDEGAVATTYLPFEDGDFGQNITIDVSSSGGIDSEGQVIPIKGGTYSSVKKITIDNEINIKIYPNPNNGNFKISGSATKEGTLNIQIVNIMGQTIYSQEVNIDEGYFKIPIQIDNLSDGIYSVKTTVNNYTSVKQIVIN